MVNISRIDLNLFVVFNAIYTQHGITRASKALNLSQSAISHALNRLRDATGDSLFVRDGNSITPTPVAHDLAGPIQRALAEFEGSLNQLRAFDPKCSKREFAIGIDYLLETSWIPELMREITTMAPNVTISAVRHQHTDVETLLTSGALVAVVDKLLPLSKDIHHRYLGSWNMVVLVRRGHPSVGENMSLETYLDQDHILVSSPTHRGAADDDTLPGLEPGRRRVKLRCQSYITACKMVSTSDMLLTIPHVSVQGLNDLFGINIVPFPIDVAAQGIFMYWHASSENDRATSWLRRQIVASFRHAAIDPTPASAVDATITPYPPLNAPLVGLRSLSTLS